MGKSGKQWREGDVLWFIRPTGQNYKEFQILRSRYLKPVSGVGMYHTIKHRGGLDICTTNTMFDSHDDAKKFLLERLENEYVDLLARKENVKSMSEDDDPFPVGYTKLALKDIGDDTCVCCEIPVHRDSV